MAEPAKPAVFIADFPGLLTNVDPRDLADGSAADQLNLQSIEYGAMITRAGIREVSFDESANL